MTRPVKREPHITPHPAAAGSTSSSSRLNNGGAETSDMDSQEATERRLLRSRYRDVKRIIIGTLFFLSFFLNFRSLFSSPFCLQYLQVSFLFGFLHSLTHEWCIFVEKFEQMEERTLKGLILISLIPLLIKWRTCTNWVFATSTFH
jgi:hypothetical protein